MTSPSELANTKTFTITRCTVSSSLPPFLQGMGISAVIYGMGQFESSYLRDLKCALFVLGIRDDLKAEPIRLFKYSERIKVVRQLQSLRFRN